MTVMKPGNLGSGEISLLFVGDPNLGPQGYEFVSKYFSDTTCFIWRRGDTSAERDIRERIRSRRWNILISFYNDLIFSEMELSQADIAINIHPSSPCLRGVGYDTLPLVLGHTNYGVTLHHVTDEIDAGKIIDVMKEDLPSNISYTNFRALTQRLCCRMLERTILAIHRFKEPSQIHQFLCSCGERSQAEWSSHYVSRKQLNQIMDALRRDRPDHCVFK
jgi:methionyl-tRNA formyltransferase